MCTLGPEGTKDLSTNGTGRSPSDPSPRDSGAVLTRRKSTASVSTTKLMCAFLLKPLVQAQLHQGLPIQEYQHLP